MSESIALECEYCKMLVSAEVLKAYVATDPQDLAPALRFLFAKCPRCEAPFLAQQEEDVPEGRRAPERMFPITDVRLAGALPKPIQAAFEEASRCMCSNAFTAAAVMCRKALEGICAAHGVNERSLATSLEKLRDDGTIDRRLYEWADELRLFGNDAAHDLNVVISGEDAADIMDFTRALVEYVFTFRERFEQFRQRRKRPPADT
jgi:hypothetical protein